MITPTTNGQRTGVTTPERSAPRGANTAMTDPRANPPTAREVVLSVRDLRKTYPRRGRQSPQVAVDGVSFDVGRGEILGLLGPNGAGKTTTIKMICGLVRPDAGDVHVLGIDARREPRRALRHLSAVLEGNRNLYWRLTARENMACFAGNRGRSGRAVAQEIDALLETFRLTGKRDALVGELSRGMQQKLAIAVALLAGGDIVLLDEPTLGLDVETGYEVREHLRALAALGRTVIVSTHDMPVVEDLCERTVVIDGGRVITDDRVDNLLRLFASRAYQVRLGKPLSARQVEALVAGFVGAQVDDDGLGFAVDLERGEDLYRLVDVLREEGTPIESLDRTTIAFETVFRRLVNGNGGVR
jgi:ABC-2 type transport system ATP-binding protein